MKTTAETTTLIRMSPKTRVAWSVRICSMKNRPSV
jgi:hypothetical protein